LTIERCHLDQARNGRVGVGRPWPTAEGLGARCRRERVAAVGLLGDVADAAGAVGGLVQAGDPFSYQFL
jgi:hypothetical protein